MCVGCRRTFFQSKYIANAYRYDNGDDDDNADDDNGGGDDEHDDNGKRIESKHRIVKMCVQVFTTELLRECLMKLLEISSIRLKDQST